MQGSLKIKSARLVPAKRLISWSFRKIFFPEEIGETKALIAIVGGKIVFTQAK
jgi:hypothetical protein